MALQISRLLVSLILRDQVLLPRLEQHGHETIPDQYPHDALDAHRQCLPEPPVTYRKNESAERADEDHPVPSWLVVSDLRGSNGYAPPQGPEEDDGLCWMVLVPLPQKPPRSGGAVVYVAPPSEQQMEVVYV